MPIIDKVLFEDSGHSHDAIPVKISNRVIHLFSEGLYSSPNKALEELVSNSFDAGAENVHIVLSPDLRDARATITVIDDGEGMGSDELKRHWIIGESTRSNGSLANGRKPIGKFGIGKLATYVLANKFTHITKSRGLYFAATMDYSEIGSPQSKHGGIFDEQTVTIPLRLLTEDEARAAVDQWIHGKKPGFSALKLFGPNSKKSWTVAIMSGLKELGQKIKLGRLRWVLRTAMPQRSDFNLFLDGDPITPPELDKPVAKYILGKDIKKLPSPCTQDIEPREDPSEPQDSIHHYGLYNEELLGRVTGYIEIFKDELDRGKEKFETSGGFFVYVHGRRVNVDDPGFGIERNLLRHGTFSRFRMVVHVDALNVALRSSRESFQQGDLYEAVQNLLRAGFNHARNRLVSFDQEQTPSARIARRLSSAPGSMTRKPLLALAHLIAEKRAAPFYLRIPTELNGEKIEIFLDEITKKSESPDGFLRATEFAALDSKDGIAVLDLGDCKLKINSSHPFTAAFQEMFTDPRQSLPLEMLAMSEVIMEAHLYQLELDEKLIRDIISRRDELLRQLVRSTRRRTVGMIALALTEARDDANKLEEEMRAAFEAMGFDNVIRIGGKGKPDGTAEAHLAATSDGFPRRYKVGLEAKSGQSVSAHRLDVSAIARHMKEFDCDHHLVIGNGFATSEGDSSATVKQIQEHYRTTNRTITLMHIDDLARLIRIAATKKVGGLSRIRELFKSAITPEESKGWIDKLSEEHQEQWPYKEILEAIWTLARAQPNETVEYAAIVTELRHHSPPVNIKKNELLDCCKAMQVMARDIVYARESSVEIDRRPDLILEDIRSAVSDASEIERRGLDI